MAFGRNPLAFLLNMTWAQFDSYNRTAQTECLDLLADELAELPTNRPLLVDGGITHPSLLVQCLSAEKIVCLSASMLYAFTNGKQPRIVPKCETG